VQNIISDTSVAKYCCQQPSNGVSFRIFVFWSFFRRGNIQWWMELFHSFVDDGIFHVGHRKETDCMRFCFMAVLRRNLNDVVHQWNTYHIRPTAGSHSPPGVPDELFYFPAPPAVDCLQRNIGPVTNDIIQSLQQPAMCDDDDFADYLVYLCQHHGWQPPQSITESEALYRNLQPLI